MFSYLSLSSISWATVTPSLVILGAPHPLSMTAFRPRGPRVAFTARANLVTPSSNALRASASKASILAAMPNSCFERFAKASRDRWTNHRRVIHQNKGDATGRIVLKSLQMRNLSHILNDLSNCHAGRGTMGRVVAVGVVCRAGRPGVLSAFISLDVRAV